MAILPVRLFGDPVLRTVAEEVTTFGPELGKLIDDMMETMDHNQGAGLAAPQVGVSRRVFVYDCGGQRGHIVNPVWEAVGEETQRGPEGCLSVPGIQEDCTRYASVRARGKDRDGNDIAIGGTEILARCIQHETDHLDGIMFMKRLDPDQRKAAMREIRDAGWFGLPAISGDSLVDTDGRPLAH